MRFLVAAALSALASTTAHAAPIYLNCLIVSGDIKMEVQVTADEANGAATVFIPSVGRTVSMVAAFRPAEVIISDRFGFYRIDRRSLAIERTIRMLSGVDRGTCKIEKAPTRAF